jgi:ABC-2 type transport system ATP-binding protein
MTVAISINGLTKHYNALTAVDHLSLNIEEGEVFGFLGPNGAGKTTTIRMLVGLTTPSDGTATVAGYDINDDIVEVKKRVGVVPETSNLYDEISVWDNLLFSSRLYHVPKNERADKIHNLLKTFNLEERRNTKFGKLSKGLKRRVVIAAALVHQPRIVFMDEPTTGLDVVSALSLRSLIEELRAEETTVFLTTHYIEEADQLSDRIAIIVKGKIVTVDTPENIKQSVRGVPILEVLLTHEPESSTIKELEAVGSVEHNGCLVRIEVEEVTEAIESLSGIAAQSGMMIEDIATIRPSLEEAFVNLTGVSSEVMRAEKEGRRS